ncbi:MAG: hypothetical protein ACREDS_07825, partial [Limisphaerales bacterium]
AMDLAMHGTPGWNPAALKQMLAGANWASDRLHLSTPHPIRASDLVNKIIGPPGVSVATNRLRDDYRNPDIPRETRLRAITFGVSGAIDTTNYEFGFAGGRLCQIRRIDYWKTGRLNWLSEGSYFWPTDELQLVDKPSLIKNDAQAHALAVQWLTALDIDVAGLKWTVGQQHYRPRGGTNVALLPIYSVNFGNIHYPAVNNIPASDSPQVHVKILGPNKELQQIMVNWVSLSICHAPLLLMPHTLALTPHDKWIKELQRFHLIPDASALTPTSNSPPKQLTQPPTMQTNSASP